MDHRLRPNFERSPNLQDILGSYGSAKEALAAGNHYIALLKARAENVPEIENAALIMCGAIRKNSNGLKPGTLIQEAYGQWCLGNNVVAGEILKNFQGSSNLVSLLKKPAINVLILYGPHTKHHAPAEGLEGFQIIRAMVKRDETAPPLSDIIPRGFQPDAIIVLDIYGQRLPNDLYDFNGPVIFLNYDFDFQLAYQHQDLQRADLIVGNGAYEHYYLDRIYDCPVSVFPTIILPFEKPNILQTSYKKDIDFLHTGLSFTPIMREKAQFLFRIATIDNPDLNIRIHHGFMDNEKYLSHIRRSKFMPIFCGRMYGGIQSRTVDALINGSFALHGGQDVAIDLLEANQLTIRCSSSSNLEEDVAQNLRTYPEDWQSFNQNQTLISAELEQLFLKPRDRDKRFIKYCLFEVARFNFRRKKTNALRTTSVVGLDRCLFLAKSDKKNRHSLYSLALYRAIENVVNRPLDEKRRDIVKSIFAEASSLFPGSLALLFNYARYQWLIGEKNDAFATFQILIDGLHSHYFEPTRDLVWLRIFENTLELMPPQDYFMSLADDVATGNQESKNGRAVIGATAMSYMAIHHLQKKNLKIGLTYLDRALNLFPNHFPAARLRFKTLHALGEDCETTSEAFNRAVNLYPPFLTDLLHLGVSNELAQRKEMEALSLVKTWVYFITRCTWDREESLPIPESTWKTVRAFLNRLPRHLQNKLKEEFPREMG
ncbi:MAG TPA: hypothetical protein EYN55_06585 [Rhodospirillales bacterium]|nr:hypothetical protein [Rhodospirillales bacterium]